MAKTLDEYRRKRDFSATPEPSADTRKRRRKGEQALQFCIQKHDASRLHYDFRLELDGTLKSWAVPKGPSLDPKVRRLAVQVEDHPLDYATFEGNIPEGHYGAGDVIVWDRGLWKPEGDPQDAYRKGRLTFELDGEKLSGRWHLVRTHLKGRQEQWFLIKSDDASARSETDYDVVKACPDSVLSGRTLVPRKRGAASKKAEAQSIPPPARRRKRNESQALAGATSAALPDTLSPQLAMLVESAPEGDWRYEIKFDGYRILARVEAGKVRLFTRNGHDWTARMPRQAEALAGLGLESAWLDGEVVVLDEQGLPDFQALQNAFEAGGSDRIIYCVFDAPYLNGMDLRGVGVEQRRAALAAVMEGHGDPLLRFSEDFAEEPEHMLESACRLKLEGLIAKRAGSPYVSRRSSHWIKIKCKHRQEFVIVGYTDPKGARNAFGALLLGLHEKEGGALRYAGKVGTGFNEITLRTLHAKLRPLETGSPPVANPPSGAEARGAHWLKPELMCEVAYAEMTRDGVIRHSVFHGLRDDKPVSGITHELAESPGRVAASSPDTGQAGRVRSGDADEVEGIRITHPDRVVDPSSGATKRDVVRYYARVAPWILRDLLQRPVAMVRAPEGIAGELFFQKHATRRAMPHVRQVEDPEDSQPLLVVDTPQALISAAQMGVVELHGWNATAPELDRPDRFVLDLDPDPALPWKHMIEATQLVLTLLDELGLEAFLKTSGGKGIHLVVPLDRSQSWQQVKGFSQAIARHMSKLMPDRFSALSGPKNRVGKIFIDYLRNGRGATSVAAYSLRAREGLPLSVPIRRDELSHLAGAHLWTLRNLFERLEEQVADDPWSGLPGVRQRITRKHAEQLGFSGI